MMKLILIICILSLSCSNNESKIKDDLKSLNSSNINIPNKLDVVYNGKYTVNKDSLNSGLKLIIYADSTGCSSCSISKLHLWKPFIEYSKKYNEKLKLIFIFRPTYKGINSLINTMMTNSIGYPMLIDLNGDFERLNPHLPKNKAMHTFLLDENNKVILVGNPLHNKEIEKMFYKITQEKLSK